ncbi:MAG: methionine--tRNA ligase [Candidatus Lambdaproteobacteria bacterium]|nr:methionine--tRNA ligase [Candidatus Lambdaproteobacteria bacterium]
MSRKIMINVAWPYANGPRHIGHVAGFGVPSDIFARYHRLAGNDVLMVSGTDEHGTPITVQAEKEGVTPQELVDRYNEVIGDDLYKLGLSYDLFTRTTTRNHYRVTQDLFRILYAKGYILKKFAPGAFSRNGRTLPDRYIEGTCPLCGYGEARGDQCDNCGKQLDPQDLINPRSKIDGEPPVFRDSEHFFLDLTAFVDPLKRWIETQHHWRTNVRNFSLNLLENLQPRPITRDLEWGIPIPLPDYEHLPDKKIYVWFDAVIGYLSASVEWAAQTGDPEAWRTWWQNPDALHYYFMGKDNIVFHALIWPSMLIGYGNGMAGSLGGGSAEPLNIPHDIVSSEFLTMEGRKFSSSRGVVIYVKDVLARYDADALRYFLAIAGPESQDTDFTWAEFLRRNNDELVASWGNLVNRVLTIAHKNYGAVPQPGELNAADLALLATMEGGFAAVGAQLEAANFKAAVGATMRLADAANRYISDQEPWRLVKSDPPRGRTVLYTALRAVDCLKILFAPVLPFSSQRLHELLGYEGSLSGTLGFKQVTEEEGRSHRVLTGDYSRRVGRWEAPQLPIGRKLSEPQPLFKKLDEGIVEEELARLEAHT